MDIVVHIQFVIFEVDTGKDGIFLESVISDQVIPIGQVSRRFFLLVIAAQEEKYLGLEGVPFPIPVELSQKRVLFEDFEHELGAESGLEHLSQSSFSDPDYSLDSDIHKFGVPLVLCLFSALRIPSFDFRRNQIYANLSEFPLQIGYKHHLLHNQ